MRYIIRRLLFFIAAIFATVTVTFLAMKAIPGDPFLSEEAMTSESGDLLRKKFGFDQSLGVQYVMYIKALVHGDLGSSLKYHGETVVNIIREGFPISATLGLEALALAVPFGVLMGTIAAMRPRGWLDVATTSFASLGISIPSFILAALLQYFLAMKLGLFPVARWGSFSQTILPAIALSALPMAFIARLTRANMLEVLQQEYIKTAIAKGLSWGIIIKRHALRNALLPVFSYLGPVIANILTGSFIVEQVFAIPGLGQWFVLGVMNRDYPIIMGLTIFYSIILLTAILLVDIAIACLDPRIRKTLMESS